MKRLTIQRLTKEYEEALSQMDDHWNDVEIVVDGRNFRALYTDSPEEAFDKWRSETGDDYRRIAVRINHIDEHGDIQDLNHLFEYELGT